MTDEPGAGPEYSLSGFANPNTELERLRAQAGALLDREFALQASIGFQPNGRGLDVGCGPAFVAERMAAHWRVLIEGVERDPGALALAPASIPVHQADATVRLPFEDAAFDFAITRLLLRHVDQPSRVVSEMTRVVRPGGQVLLADADDAALILHPRIESFDTVFQRRLEMVRATGADPHVGRRLRSLLEEQNFSDIRGTVMVATSEEMGCASFQRILLTPFIDAVGFANMPSTLLDTVRMDLDAWTQDPSSFGMACMVIFTGTRR